MMMMILYQYQHDFLNYLNFTLFGYLPQKIPLIVPLVSKSQHKLFKLMNGISN